MSMVSGVFFSILVITLSFLFLLHVAVLFVADGSTDVCAADADAIFGSVAVPIATTASFGFVVVVGGGGGDVVTVADAVAIFGNIVVPAAAAATTLFFDFVVVASGDVVTIAGGNVVAVAVADAVADAIFGSVLVPAATTASFDFVVVVAAAGVVTVALDAADAVVVVVVAATTATSFGSVFAAISVPDTVSYAFLVVVILAAAAAVVVDVFTSFLVAIAVACETLLLFTCFSHNTFSASPVGSFFDGKFVSVILTLSPCNNLTVLQAI